MGQIDNYEKFCKAFNSDDDAQKEEAKLLLFIQNWIIRILDHMEDESCDYSLEKMFDHVKDNRKNGYELKDVLSSIVDDSYLAFRHLNDNMREKILRENVQMPVYKVREINSFGLNWLSRQSGRTIKQKVSSAGNSIMAVQRRMSFDTAENRLFIAFAKEMYEYLTTKVESLEPIDRRQINKEEEFCDELVSFIRRDDILEVRRWENLPPNNTLLSDQYYKKIWNAWNELKKIDERIENNNKFIEQRLLSIFFIELLVILRDKLRIPQIPVEINYDDYNVYMCVKNFICLDDNGNQVTFKIDRNHLFINTVDKKVRLEFTGSTFSISINDEVIKTFAVTVDKIYTYINFVATKLGFGVAKNNSMYEEKKVVKYKNILVDLFSLYPRYIGDDSVFEKLPGRILQQSYKGIDIDGELKEYYIPCDTADAIIMMPDETQTYTIPFAIDNASIGQAKNLIYMLENYIETDSFTYVFPDAYNDLQLSMIHKIARMVFRNVKNIPLSIGATFKYQTTDSFVEKFNPGDFLLITNLIDDEVTFTLVGGTFEEKLLNTVNDYKGILWERHPTSTKSYKNEIHDNVVNNLTKAGCIEAEKVYNLFGLEGLKEEVARLSICFGEEWFQFTPEIKGIIDSFKLNITSAVEEFLDRNKSIIREGNVHIISLVDSFIYKGSKPFETFSKRNVLDGCKELERLEKTIDMPLWHDHLPALAIKLMYGKFDLIKDARVTPSFGKKQHIPINGTFTLPKDCKEYHFNLIQDENARKMQYEAVIKNPAFPLKNDVECELLMTYQYGDENPYELIFIPKNTNTAGFKEAKVKWSRLEKYPIENLKSPAFPAKIPWEKLRAYPGKKGDLINVFSDLEEHFKLLNNGCHIVDISNTNIRVDREGIRSGEFVLEINGENVRVQWSERGWSKNVLPPSKIEKISFWAIPKIYEDKNSKRYRISNLINSRTRENLWFINKNGSYQCIVNFEYKGNIETISILDQKFDMPERFHTNINDISFEVRRLSNGNLQAINIHDENGPEPMRKFEAINICPGMARPVPPRFFTNRYYGKCIRLLFANNRSLYEKDCPTDFQMLFAKSVDNWANLFYEYEILNNKKEIFTLLSLAANDIGMKYYQIADDFLSLYKNKDIDLPYEIGCAFCDLTNDMQIRLMNQTLSLVREDSEAICILAKAIWHNEEFVYKADLELLLKQYLPKAINYIGEALLCSGGKRVLVDDIENVKYCLEYILGIMRLRNLNDSKIIDRYLSLNNPQMHELYAYLELMVKNNIKIHSFLRLEITSKGRYNNICDLLYVMLVYVTGSDTEGEIRISIDLD